MSKISQALNRTGITIDSRDQSGASGRSGVSAAFPDPAILKLYFTVDALKAQRTSLVVQFIAATVGEGTTTIATGFATVAANESKQDVLLINCTPSPAAVSSRVSLCTAFKQGLPLKEATVDSKTFPNLHVAQLSDSPNPLVEIGSEGLNDLIAALRKDFATVVLDCPAAAVSPDATAISRYCDGTVLVVRAEYVRPAVVRSVQDNIGLVGGQIVGVAFNRRRMYIPEWMYRWL